ncbi:hypothetical protein PoB_003070700 [Plakobranchus ocellatus]|uniref:Uncharacterized protein n=1 Tax=Plakobranchus ocellatus TaxID=259542 RepID=A0AAV4AB27_9GAST|nr:hypothetical protein PoB_003070700 [Plakobranchus ocellatus]
MSVAQQATSELKGQGSSDATTQWYSAGFHRFPHSEQAGHMWSAEKTDRKTDQFTPSPRIILFTCTWHSMLRSEGGQLGRPNRKCVQRSRGRVTLPQKDSRVKIAAARNTLKTLWRPPGRLQSAFGGRRIDSVYAKTTLARGRPTLNNNNNNKIPYSYCSWQGGMVFTFDEFEHFFQKKIYPSSKYDNPGKKKNFRRVAAKFYSWDAILHPMVKNGNQCELTSFQF